MSNPDTNQPGTISGYIQMLMSAPTLAALRYMLAMIAPCLALFGFTGLTPDKIDLWVAYAKTFGTAALAIMAFLGIVVPLGVALIGVLSATVKKQIARVRDLANNPQLASAEAAKALTAATSQLAKSNDVQTSKDAVEALVHATINLNKVQTIVATPDVAEAVPGAVVADTEHKVVPAR